jgi:hypothetical protein
LIALELRGRLGDNAPSTVAVGQTCWDISRRIPYRALADEPPLLSIQNWPSVRPLCPMRFWPSLSCSTGPPGPPVAESRKQLLG